MENIWQFIRENWLSNHVYRDHDEIVDHCCHAWNRLIDQPWRIMSNGRQKPPHSGVQLADMAQAHAFHAQGSV